MTCPSRVNAVCCQVHARRNVWVAWIQHPEQHKIGSSIAQFLYAVEASARLVSIVGISHILKCILSLISILCQFHVYLCVFTLGQSFGLSLPHRAWCRNRDGGQLMLDIALLSPPFCTFRLLVRLWHEKSCVVAVLKARFRVNDRRHTTQVIVGQCFREFYPTLTTPALKSTLYISITSKCKLKDE